MWARASLSITGCMYFGTGECALLCMNTPAAISILFLFYSNGDPRIVPWNGRIMCCSPSSPSFWSVMVWRRPAWTGRENQESRSESEQWISQHGEPVRVVLREEADGHGETQHGEASFGDTGSTLVACRNCAPNEWPQGSLVPAAYFQGFPSPVSKPQPQYKRDVSECGPREILHVN
jgi:hypothetical protein